MRIALVVVALLAAGCVHRKPLPKELPMTLSLEPYRDGLKTLRVGLASKPYTFLFDTGAGVTIITPEVAKAIGCEPWGSIVGQRMHGEQVELKRCDRVVAGIDTFMRELPEVGVLDVMSLLPADWPKVDGVVSLAAIAPKTATLDWRADKVVLETTDTLSARAAKAIVPMRVARSASGVGVDVFVAVAGKKGPLWFLVDSATTGPVLLAKHAAEVLGLAAPEGDVTLAFSQGVAVTLKAAVDDKLIYDGVLGVSALEKVTLSLDFKAQNAWVDVQ